MFGEDAYDEGRVGGEWQGGAFGASWEGEAYQEYPGAEYEPDASFESEADRGYPGYPAGGGYARGLGYPLQLGFGPGVGYEPSAGYEPSGGYGPEAGYGPEVGYGPEAGYSPEMGYGSGMGAALEPLPEPPGTLAPVSAGQDWGDAGADHEYGPPVADTLTTQSLLYGKRPVPVAGWRRNIYRASGGLVRFGESAAVMRRRDLLNRIRTPVAG